VDIEVASAVERLVGEGNLTPEQALVPRRAARGELLSVRFELRTLLWLGVSLVVSGVGLLVKENLDRIGPLTIAVTLGAAAAACLTWVARVSPPFSWGEQPSPNLAFDYVLLLGAALIGADLAFIEVKFTPLGPNWPWHLFWTSLAFAALAVRFDSRVVWSLALSTFAAWRGVSMGTLASAPLGNWQPAPLRANSIACGAIFVLGGFLLLHLRRKPHFEPVAVHMGWLLVLGGLAAGMLDPGARTRWAAWALALLAVAGVLTWLAARAHRFWLFAIGLLGAYAAVSRFVVESVSGDTQRQVWFLASSIALVVALVRMRHRLEEAL
jgi:hypothetical protein